MSIVLLPPTFRKNANMSKINPSDVSSSISSYIDIQYNFKSLSTTYKEYTGILSLDSNKPLDTVVIEKPIRINEIQFGQSIK